MRAMILAAGLGTRLRPLTETQPKALIEVAGVPMIEIIIRKLVNFGIENIVVNVHHFANTITDFLTSKNHFGIHIEISYEKEIWGTGGGLQKAAKFFSHDAPFLLHNVDVLSNLDFNDVLNFHTLKNSLATLVVQNRTTQRYLVFDDKDLLCGRSNPNKQNMNLVRDPKGDPKLLAFNGIHVISSNFISKLQEEGSFSIIDAYLRLASQGELIRGYNMQEKFWLDLGRPKSLNAAEEAIREGVISI